MHGRRYQEQISDKPISREQLITVGALSEFKEELLSAIKELFILYKNTHSKKWLKSYEVKKLLGISHGTLQNLRNNGTIPFSKVGGTIYYDEEDITEAIKNQKRRQLR